MDEHTINECLEPRFYLNIFGGFEAKFGVDSTMDEQTTNECLELRFDSNIFGEFEAKILG